MTRGSPCAPTRRINSSISEGLAGGDFDGLCGAPFAQEWPLFAQSAHSADRVWNGSNGSTAAVREGPGKRRLLARQRRDSGRHPSGSHQGGADIPARSPFMLRPRCRTLRALSCSDPSPPPTRPRAPRGVSFRFVRLCYKNGRFVISGRYVHDREGQPKSVLQSIRQMPEYDDLRNFVTITSPY